MNKQTEKFIEELKLRSDVLGVIMFGSWARGNNRLDSDVDLVVITTKGYRRTVEYKNGQTFEIIYTTEKGALDYWESHRDDAVGLWAAAKILFDKDGTIERIKANITEVLKAGKKPIDEFQLKQFHFDAEDTLKYVENRLISDPASANFILTNKVFALTELFFDIRQIWTPAPKQRLEEIHKISPVLYTLLNEFYKQQSDLKDKLEVAKKIITVVFRN